MSAQLVRVLATLVGLALALASVFLIAGWAGWVVALAAFVLCGWLGEKAFQARATPEQIRADLEDRVRNPPA